MKLSPLVAMLLFCTSFAIYISIQQILLNSGMSPIFLNTLCYTFAAIFLSLYLLVKNRETFVIKSKKGIALGVLISLVASVLADLLVLYGLKVGTQITWSLLLCSAPLVTYLLAVPFLKEVLTLRKLVAIGISIIGAILIIYIPGTGIDLQHGAPYFLGAVFFFGVANILTQFVFKYLSPVQLTLVKLISASFMLFALWPIMHVQVVPVNWLLVGVNGLVLLTSGLLVNCIIHTASATYFSIGTNMSPLFVTILSILIVRVWPTNMQILGGIIAIGGILLFQYTASKKISEST